MGPTARDWLGAGLLAFVLVVLVLVLVAAATGGGEPGPEALARLLLRA